MVVREAALATSRQQNALRNARSVLGRATAAGLDTRVASADSVLLYMSDKLDAPVGGLTRESLHLRLEEAGVSSDLAQRIEDTLAAGEVARYSPVPAGTGRTEDLVEQTTQLLTDLEEAYGE